jgi:hypothetical protein
MLIYIGGINTMEQNTNSASIGNSKVITINDKPVMVKKLGLIKYTIMTNSVRGLITTSLDLIRQLVTEEDVILLDKNEAIPISQRGAKIAETLTNMIDQNIMQVIKLIDICVPDLGYEYICEEVGLDDALYILKTVVEVNKLQKFGEEIKNMLRGLQISK